MITVVTVEIIRNEENAVLSIAVLETLGGEEVSKMAGPQKKGNTYQKSQ